MPRSSSFSGAQRYETFCLPHVVSTAHLSRSSGNKHTEDDSMHVHVLRQVNLDSEILAILRSSDCTEIFGKVNSSGIPAHGANTLHCGVSMLGKVFCL